MDSIAGNDSENAIPHVLSVLTKSRLTDLAHGLFLEEGSFQKLGIDDSLLFSFIRQVSQQYQENPYHNYHHAVDTINTMLWMITRPVFAEKLSPDLRFLLMLSVLVHDLGHPGHNNTFEVNTASDRARRFNNASVLENYSIELSWELLDDPEYNIFKGFPPQKVSEYKRIIKELVLSTDFEKHQDFMSGFQGYLEEHPADFNNHEFISWVTRALVKSADIANTTKPFEEAKLWGRRIMLEFWAQGAREKELNITVGPFNDPESIHINIAQAGFIRYAALNLFQSLTIVEPEFEKLVETLKGNLNRYEEMEACGEHLFD